MTETQLPPSGPGTVVLNLGADTGALIVHTPASMDGDEIEISRTGSPAAARTHSQVRERRTSSSVKYAAVYPDLPAGDYTIWRDAATPAAAVTITGGSITSFHWPD
ncbi:MAG TPA: hypothetical protein VKS82_17935 [Streptosporangiaceae bacterium]|nr:hypothetical protein [Streptosporangiaceae bacterium]